MPTRCFASMCFLISVFRFVSLPQALQLNNNFPLAVEVFSIMELIILRRFSLLKPALVSVFNTSLKGGCVLASLIGSFGYSFVVDSL